MTHELANSGWIWSKGIFPSGERMCFVPARYGGIACRDALCPSNSSCLIQSLARKR